MMMAYTVNPGIWTELAEYGVELIHHAGQAINVEVADGQIETTPDHVEFQLRSPDGRYPKGWRAPIAGTYVFGAADSHYRIGATVKLTLDDVVIEDAQAIPSVDGAVYAGPSIRMNSSGRLAA